MRTLLLLLCCCCWGERVRQVFARWQLLPGTAGCDVQCDASSSRLPAAGITLVMVIALRHSLWFQDPVRGNRRYRTTAEEDEAIIASSSAGPRQKVATRLLRIEKAILTGAPDVVPGFRCVRALLCFTISPECFSVACNLQGPIAACAGALQEVLAGLGEASIGSTDSASRLHVRLSLT